MHSPGFGHKVLICFLVAIVYRNFISNACNFLASIRLSSCFCSVLHGGEVGPSFRLMKFKFSFIHLNSVWDQTLNIFNDNVAFWQLTLQGVSNLIDRDSNLEPLHWAPRSAFQRKHNVKEMNRPHLERESIINHFIIFDFTLFGG